MNESRILWARFRCRGLSICFTEALFFATKYEGSTTCRVEMLEALSKLWCPANTEPICRSCCWASASTSPVLATLLSKAWWKTRLGSFISIFICPETRKWESLENGNPILTWLGMILIQTWKSEHSQPQWVCKLDVADATWSTERFLWNFDSNPDRTSFWASKPCACSGHCGSTGGTLNYGWRVEVLWGVAVQQYSSIQQ